jgi:hypothetical protein
MQDLKSFTGILYLKNIPCTASSSVIYFFDSLQKIWLIVYVFFWISRVFNSGGSRRFVPMAMMAIA